MDPMTAMLTALAAGAAVAPKETSDAAIKDAYTKLRTLIKKRYSRASIELLETNPHSRYSLAVLRDDLAAAATDRELLAQAQVLLQAIEADKPEMIRAIGVDPDTLTAAQLRISDVLAGNTDVEIKQGEFSDEIEDLGLPPDIQSDTSTNNP